MKLPVFGRADRAGAGRRGVAVIVALVLGGSLSACDSGGDDAGSASGSSSATRAASVSPSVSSSPSPPPPPPPVSPAEFAAALAEVDAALSPLFAEIGRADSPARLGTAFEQAAGAADAAATKLRKVLAPTDVTAAATGLADGLAALADDLTDLSEAASDADLCTAASGVPRLSALPSLAGVRDVAGRLGAVNPTYKVAGFVPPVQPEPNRQGTNGSLSGGRRGGSGELTVKNERGSNDAVIKLTVGTGVIREVYVRGGSQTTIDGIPDGTVTAFYTTGKDWDAAAKKFTRDCAFQKFDNTLDFRTTRTQYTIYELTLYTVTGGNATTSEVKPEDFPTS